MQGACLCGTVRYEVEGPVTWMIHCHCSMCRKHHGALFGTFAATPLMRFRWLAGEDNIERYASSEHAQRGFCKTCGSVTPTLLQSMDLAIFPAGNVTENLEARPQSHLFIGSKPSWHRITDALPQYEEYPPEFGEVPTVERPLVEAREGVTEGSCLCGKVAFEATGPAMRMMNCHCSRCRLARSAAHATNVLYKLEDFHFTRGEELVKCYHVPGAQYFKNCFCSHCGSPTARVSPERGFVVVPAGALDTDPHVEPTAHIFVGSKANWFDITDGVPQYSEAMT